MPPPPPSLSPYKKIGGGGSVTSPCSFIRRQSFQLPIVKAKEGFFNWEVIVIVFPQCDSYICYPSKCRRRQVACGVSVEKVLGFNHALCSTVTDDTKWPWPFKLTQVCCAGGFPLASFSVIVHRTINQPRETVPTHQISRFSSFSIYFLNFYFFWGRRVRLSLNMQQQWIDVAVQLLTMDCVCHFVWWGCCTAEKGVLYITATCLSFCVHVCIASEGVCVM